MGLLAAIALICQVNIGEGSSRWNVNYGRIDSFQNHCQKKLIECTEKLAGVGTITEGHLLTCIKERKSSSYLQQNPNENNGKGGL